MRYFKIVYGYNEGDYVPITEDELPKAFALFLEGNGRGIFGGEGIRGQDIIRITEDWHRARGWNRGWKMTVEDYADIKPLENEYRLALQEAKEVARFALEGNRRDVLSLPLSESIKILPPKNNLISSGVGALAEKMRIK